MQAYKERERKKKNIEIVFVNKLDAFPSGLRDSSEMSRWCCNWPVKTTDTQKETGPTRSLKIK